MTTDPRIAYDEHWAKKGDVSLFVARKRLRERSADQTKRLPVVLVHGSSNSALPTFDLTVPGHPDYSFMDWLALRGWDVWAMDHEGYGRSTVTPGNSDIATGVEDLKATARVIAAETGMSEFNLYGLSSGSLRVAAFAQGAPEHAARIVLDAFVWTGEGSPTLEKRRAGVAQFRASNRRAIDIDYIVGIFLRDGPGTTDPAVAEACARAQLLYDDSVPTGTYLDMTTKLPLVDPDRIAAPTFMVRGEHDSLATMDDLLAFFNRLPTNDKRFAVLPHLAHIATLGKARHVLWNAVDEFFRSGVK
ncbi:alpha/beta hydrolase fold protein [Afipia carboxidovorans OM5]|uniref:Putative hydrolase/acyltransferase n=1 Tax=Afipia carboxidovorans (strain ATCC 49405 / DSM 1227 / KCTC 32145 / OM5) TaxID=504832 RepID=B6JIG0_AFIC5|nr:alpha/beta fold hydrolase [Afipia carboxidovorans]ACI94200.1 alpha/beta hydrolase fold protein [Afipia carboxidovorans OM5]AEI02149.1 putative hydrolase/acyltransferase [Afipia carboxidovorans OM4]AEI05725.1 putative hydrolase/acyltransferase [Afipia carboxidovorans OM5]